MLGSKIINTHAVDVISIGFAIAAAMLTIGCEPPAVDPIEPNLASIQEFVFDKSCMGSSCHGPVPIHGWDLTDGNSYDTLVGVQSNVEPDYYLVKPGDPDNSLLVKKLEGTSVSPSMPFFLLSVAQYKIDAIRGWISSLSPSNLPPLNTTPEANLNWLQPNVFDVSCAYSGCHDSITAAASLDLTANILDNMVNVPSTQFGVNFNLIEPGDPANSYLVKKLRDTQSFGVAMPYLVPQLSEAKLTAIETWITDMQPQSTPTPSPTSEPVPEDSLEWVQANVFAGCTNCHGNNAQAGLDLREGVSYDNLVGVYSTQEPGKYRVVVGNATDSYLIQKLEGGIDVISGDPMPPPNGGIPQSAINNVRAWIDGL